MGPRGADDGPLPHASARVALLLRQRRVVGPDVALRVVALAAAGALAAAAAAVVTRSAAGARAAAALALDALAVAFARVRAAVRGVNGRGIEAVYEMVREDRGWRINGVVTRPDTSETA